MPSFTPENGFRGSVIANSGLHTHLIIRVHPGCGQVRVTEGPHTGFRPGDGVPQVEIADPTEVLQLANGDTHLTEFTVRLDETG